MSCIAVLKEKGLRLTPQRKLIVNIFHDSDVHLATEDIIRTVKTQMPGVNKSTIYRTLNLLEELGCVCKTELEDKSVFHHSKENLHNHLVCTRCGKFQDCDKDLFESIESELDKKYGFSVNFDHTVIVGICLDCRNKATG